jgi:hypothetical protein
MTVIGFAMLLKIVIGGMYSIGYRFNHKINDKMLNKNNKGIVIDSKFNNISYKSFHQCNNR